MEAEGVARRRVGRRVVLWSLLVVLLLWAGGFIWMVAAELKLEDDDSYMQATISKEAILGAGTAQEMLRIVNEAMEPELVIDWAVFEAGGVGRDTPLWPEELAAQLRENEKEQWEVYHVTNSLAALLALEAGVDRNNLVVHYEYNRIIMTTEDRLPAFDATAKVREWWHAAKAWWD